MWIRYLIKNQIMGDVVVPFIFLILVHYCNLFRLAILPCDQSPKDSLKFIFSKNATKIDKMFTVDLTLTP